MIRAVLFDVGGPLDLEAKFEAAIDADLRSGLELEGFTVTDEAWDAAHRYAVESFSPRLYHTIVWQLTAGDYAASVRVYDRMEARAAKRTDLFELRDGIAEVLAALKSRGLKLGLAANQPSKALRSLDEAGIGHLFENEGVSGVYGFRKPDIRLFLRACEDLGVQPEECIMVGDRIDNDVVPAHLLGMRTVLIRTGRHREQQPRSWEERPDFEVEDAAGILRAIESLLERDGS